MSSEALMPKYSSNPTAFGPLAIGRVKSTFQPSAPFSMAPLAPDCPHRDGREEEDGQTGR
jgi:hypothetical protein